MEQKKYTIKAVSLLTGLSQHVIRAWERRYNAVIPGRSDKNRRLYSDDEVERLKLLSKVVSMGLSIGDVALLPSSELHKIVKKYGTDYQNEAQYYRDSSGTTQNNKDISYNKYLEACLYAISKYEQPKFADILLKASIDLSLTALLNEMIIPLITIIGDNWNDGKFKIAQEHMATSVLISFLHNLKDIYKPITGAPLLISAAPGIQHHELGALIVSVIAASEGWQVLHLGTNIPVKEITETAKTSMAKVICISLVYPMNDKNLKEDIIELSQLCNEEKKIIAGGRAAHSYSDILQKCGIPIIDDINLFRNSLSRYK